VEISVENVFIPTYLFLSEDKDSVDQNVCVDAELFP